MPMRYFTDPDIEVPAVTTEQMLEVDRVAIEDTGPNLLQMMENAGRNLAEQAIANLGPSWRTASIVEKQFALQRVADVAIDLFVGLSVLSRASSMQADDNEQHQQALAIAHMFSQKAKRRMNHNLRAVLRNEDESAKSLADYIFDNEGYKWDVL